MIVQVSFLTRRLSAHNYRQALIITNAFKMQLYHINIYSDVQSMSGQCLKQ